MGGHGNTAHLSPPAWNLLRVSFFCVRLPLPPPLPPFLGREGGVARRMAVSSAPCGASLSETWGVPRAVDFIVSGDYESATLQFPDELLRSSVSVARAVEAGCRARGCGTRVYVGADSTFSPLGVDEIAAEHVPRACVVHYGRASLRATSRVPALFVLPRGAMDVEGSARAVASSEAAVERVAEARGPASGGTEAGRADVPRPHLVVFLDQPLLEHASAFETALGAALRAAHGPGALPRVVLARPARLESVPGKVLGTGGGAGGSSQTAVQKSTSSKDEVEEAAGAADGVDAASDRAVSGGAEVSREGSRGNARVLGSSFGGGDAGPSGPFSPLPPCTRLDGCAGYLWLVPSAAQTGEGEDLEGQDAGQEAGQDANGDEDEDRASAASSSPSSSLPLSSLFFLGPEEAPALRELLWSFSTADWTVFDPTLAVDAQSAQGPAPSSPSLSASPSPSYALTRGLPRATLMALRRRYAATQRLRDASVVGLLVGTLSAQGFVEALRSLRSLCIAAGKKPYTLAMGRPNPAKLANFPEIEAFVLVGDGADAVLESHDYLAPVLTPFEAKLALDPDGPLWTVEGYRMGLEGVLGTDLGNARSGDKDGRNEKENGDDDDAGEDGDRDANDVDNAAPDGSSGTAAPTASETEVSPLSMVVRQARDALAAPGTLSGGPAPGALTSSVIARGHANAAEYLHARRTWRGVEAPGGEPEEARPAGVGRAGRAAGYAEERDL